MMGKGVELPMTPTWVGQLPWPQQVENIVLAGGGWPVNPIKMVLVVQWCISTWRAQYATWVKQGRRGLFVPRMPRTIEVFNYLSGESCVDIRRRLEVYGVSASIMNLRYELWPDGKGIGLRCKMMVPYAQWAMADAILAQSQGSTYTVEAQAGPMRRYKFGRPWGVRAKARSFEEVFDLLIFGFWLKRTKVELKVKGKRARVTQKRKRAMA